MTPTIIPRPRGRTGYEKTGYTKALLTLASVCHKWRATALDSALIWSQMDHHSRDQVHCFLVRSKEAPLVARVREDLSLRDPEYGNVVSFLRPYANRLHRLDLYLYRNNDDPSLSLSFSAPHLESLIIRHRPSARSSRVNTPMARQVLILNETSVPSLKALAMVCVCGVFPRNHFPNLTHLVLDFERIYLREVPCKYILDLLSGTRLEVIFFRGLDNELSTEITPPETSTQPISLQSLRSFTLSNCDFTAISLLLSYISLPCTTFLHLSNPRVSEITPQVVETLISHLASQVPITHVDILAYERTLNLAIDGPLSGIFVGGLSQNPYGVPFHTPVDWDRFLHCLPQCLPTLSDVRSIHVSVAELNPEAIPALLGSMAQLTELHVGLAAYDETEATVHVGVLCEALAAPVGDDWQSNKARSSDFWQRNMLCPLLETLKISAECDLASVPNGIANSLRDMLASRKRAGYPLERVMVQPSEGTRSAFSQLPSAQEDAFGFLAKYVAECTVVGPGEEFGGFMRRGVWDIPRQERYWRMGEEERPYFRKPSLYQ